jgi:ACS family pantothenate transporter-like MFS transporter
VTAAIQLLLWRDKRRAARAEIDGSLEASRDGDTPELQASDVDEKKAVRTNEITLVSLD